MAAKAELSVLIHPRAILPAETREAAFDIEAELARNAMPTLKKTRDLIPNAFQRFQKPSDS